MMKYEMNGQLKETTIDASVLMTCSSKHGFIRTMERADTTDRQALRLIQNAWERGKSIEQLQLTQQRNYVSRYNTADPYEETEDDDDDTPASVTAELDSLFDRLFGSGSMADMVQAPSSDEEAESETTESSEEPGEGNAPFDPRLRSMLDDLLEESNDTATAE